MRKYAGLFFFHAIAYSAFAQQPEELAQTPDPPLTDEEFRLPLDPQTAAEVDRLIPLLNAPKFADREQATEKLIEIGAPAFAKLRDAYAQSEDLEVKLRIDQIVRTAYFNHNVFGNHGFLGVSLNQLESAVQNQKPQGAAPQNGFRISTITSGSAASRAGLIPDDVVVNINGAPVVGTGRDVIESFRKTIQSSKPGTKMKLGILRAGARLDLEVTLGQANEDVARRSSLPFSDKYMRALERFPTWWDKYFILPTAQPEIAKD